MKSSVSSARRMTIAAALAVLVAATFTTEAFADHGRERGRKWRGRWAPKRHVEVVCPAPRVVYSTPAPRICPTPVPRRVVYWASRPYYECATLGVFLPQAWLNVQIGNLPPPGYVFYDPTCDRAFSTMVAYRAHGRDCRHDRVLDVVAIDALGCRYDRRYDRDDGVDWWVSGSINLSDRD
jgi:hypothetical protein